MFSDNTKSLWSHHLRAAQTQTWSKAQSATCTEEFSMAGQPTAPEFTPRSVVIPHSEWGRQGDAACVWLVGARVHGLKSTEAGAEGNARLMPP